MRALLTAFGVLVGVLMVPFALSQPMAVLLAGVHLGFVMTAVAAAVLEGLAGEPGRARAWGFWYLLCTALAVTGLELGAKWSASPVSYWGIPFTGMLLWGWVPPVVAGASGWLGEARLQRKVKRAVRKRRKALGEDGQR